MYKTIIFDVDGTLIDTSKAVLYSLQQAILEVEHKNIPLNKLYFALGIPGKNSIKSLNIKHQNACVLRWDELYQEYFIKTSKMFDGIIDTLEALKAKGINLGIVTSKEISEKNRDFKILNLSEDYFNSIICLEETVNHKPHPEPLLHYLEKTSTNPWEAIYIGDTIHDMKCAHAANVDFALALWGAQDTTGIVAQYSLSHPKELLKLAF
ncbi:HAD family hydrolase [Vallitalea maricola]|uniref:HAD family hydrolase n=1 Tax=Vallitalea maricola TaxID=3074433 RepID=A0ACB5URX4_9FIRM|nr:HAD family hydrolase [Vallitalea sp. AN17-2]